MKKKNFINAMDTFSRLANSLNKFPGTVNIITVAPEAIIRSIAENKDPEDAISVLYRDLIDLADFLHITYLECLMFVPIYALQIRNQRPVSWNEVCDFLRFDAVKKLPLRKYISSLVEKGKLCCKNTDEKLAFRKYTVSNAVEISMQDNKLHRVAGPSV